MRRQFRAVGVIVMLIVVLTFVMRGTTTRLSRSEVVYSVAAVRAQAWLHPAAWTDRTVLVRGIVRSVTEVSHTSRQGLTSPRVTWVSLAPSSQTLESLLAAHPPSLPPYPLHGTGEARALYEMERVTRFSQAEIALYPLLPPSLSVRIDPSPSLPSFLTSLPGIGAFVNHVWPPPRPLHFQKGASITLRVHVAPLPNCTSDDSHPCLSASFVSS